MKFQLSLAALLAVAGAKSMPPLVPHFHHNNTGPIVPHDISLTPYNGTHVYQNGTWVKLAITRRHTIIRCITDPTPGEMQAFYHEHEDEVKKIAGRSIPEDVSQLWFYAWMCNYLSHLNGTDGPSARPVPQPSRAVEFKA